MALHSTQNSESGRKNTGSKSSSKKHDHAGLVLRSHFSQPNHHPFELIEWEIRESKISNPDGSLVSHTPEVEVPKSWSQLATDILASKYLRRSGVPTQGKETSAKQVVHRIAHSIRTAGEKLGKYFYDTESAESFERELTHLLIHQMAAFNSPVWFNAGLFEEYGITGQGGSYYWNSQTQRIQETSTAYQNPQCSACFIQSVDDDLMKIFDLLKNEARLFKYGSGSGTNFSSLRSRFETLSGGGLSSGLISFLEVFDRAAGATKSGGTTRRAAKMVCLDIDHPEIVDFIEWKMKEEKKARALIAAGYESDFNGESYRTVAGQNSNNSIRLSDSFMRAVEQDEEWETTYRTDGRPHQTLKARELWRKIATSSWECADPGLQFDTTINEWHTCKNSGRIRASNPCSEFMFLDNTACNLSSLNLMKFWDESKGFDADGFKHAVRIMTIAQDILVDYSSYPTEMIAKNSHDFRPIGLGYANLGSLLMVNALPYDSEKGRQLAAAVTSLLSAQAYATSAELASSKGAFDRFDENRVSMMDVLKKHSTAAQQLPDEGFSIAREAEQVWNQVVKSAAQYGIRNSQVSVLAPTGTIGLLMDCDTTGVEPDFSLVKFKKLAGGGYFKIVNQSVPRALKKLGYSDQDIHEITEHITQTLSYESSPKLSPEHFAVFDCASTCGDGKRFIQPMGHLRMMSSVQAFLSGAISKTVNLPHSTSVEEIEEIHWQAWKLGLKAVAVYRDGCKSSQPLTSKTTEAPKNEENHRAVRRRLPQKRFGFNQEARLGNHTIHLRTGNYPDGSLGEIFIDMHKEGAAFRSMMNCFAISVSLGLQYGVPLSTYVDKFIYTRFEPQGPVQHPNIKYATSVIDFIFRVLGMEYLGRTDFVQVPPDKLSELSNPPHNSPVTDDSPQKHLRNIMADAPFCDQCGHTTVRNASCYKCLNCGNSMGCS